MNIVKISAKTCRFSHIAIIIMCTIFIINLILSNDCNSLSLLLFGGGSIVDYLGESYTYVFKDFQLYRLITYGYTQTAIWHISANALALWHVGLYLEKKIGIIRFIFVYHIGMIFAGIAISVLYPDSINYGASPAIFACLGILANWWIRKRELWNEYKSQKGFHFLLYYFVVSNFLGMYTFIFHFLGFLIGFLMGYVIKENKQQNAKNFTGKKMLPHP